MFDANWHQIVWESEKPMLITLKFWKGSSFKNVSFLFLILHCCMILGQQKTVIIDPGHGGTDPGAIGINGVLEKEVVLNVAKEILKLNSSLFENEYDIYLTRYIDTLISLKERSRLAKTLNADVFVSLHCNYSDNSNARGVEVYVSNRKAKYSIEATWLAYNIQANLNRKLGFESKGVKFANFQVLRETIKYMPSVLVELGFLSNKDERDYYQNPESIKAMALAIWECLIKNLDNYERVEN